MGERLLPRPHLVGPVPELSTAYALLLPPRLFLTRCADYLN